MSKLIFNLISTVVGILLVYLGNVFIYQDTLLVDWTIAARATWLAFNICFVAIISLAPPLMFWDYYYDLKEV